jgi:hypothetical protein
VVTAALAGATGIKRSNPAVVAISLPKNLVRRFIRSSSFSTNPYWRDLR